MEIQFQLPADPTDQGLRRLRNWLLRDGDVRGAADVSLVPGGSEDGMGGSLEAVQVVLDAGFQLAGLAVAIASWRQARAPRSPLTIIYRDRSGTLPEDELADAEAVLSELERLRDADGAAESGPRTDAGPGPEDRAPGSPRDVPDPPGPQVPPEEGPGEGARA